MWRCTQYDDFDDLEQSASVTDAGLAEDVFRHLRLRILNGEFAGGDKLRELTLAKEMAVSRATIREATRRLSGAGLLDINPQRGVFVRTFSLKEIEDLYELRETLCDLIGRRFTERAGPADMAHIRTLYDMTASVREGNYKPTDYIKALAFSEAVIRATYNEKLFELYHASWQQFRLFKIHLIRTIQKGFEVKSYNKTLFFSGATVRQELMAGVAASDPVQIRQAMLHATAASRDGTRDLHAAYDFAIRSDWRGSNARWA